MPVAGERVDLLRTFFLCTERDIVLYCFLVFIGIHFIRSIPFLLMFFVLTVCLLQRLVVLECNFLTFKVKSDIQAFPLNFILPL